MACVTCQMSGVLCHFSLVNCFACPTYVSEDYVFVEASRGWMKKEKTEEKKL